MKNVFIINSHTTFLSAIGTINYLNLSADSILMLYMRNYRNSIISHNYKVFEVTGLMSSFNLFSSVSERKKGLRKIDDFIECNIGESFKLFCPHLGHGVWQAMYTNPLCLEMSYIQEGGTPYTTEYITHPSIKKILYMFLVNKVYRHTNRIWRGGWYTCGTMTKQKELHSYAINHSFFKELPSINHIIKWPSVDVSVKIKSNAKVFIFDGFIQNKLIERDFYIKKCGDLITLYASDYNYIKFHPAQTQEDMDDIIKFFSLNGYKYELLPNDIPFELILSSNRDLKLVGFGSSLLFFAHDLGHEVVCHGEWLLLSPMFKCYRKNCGFISFDEYKKLPQ